MVLASFQKEDKFEKAWFFSKNLLIGQYQYGSSFRYAFSHFQQCKHLVCKEETYLKVLHHYQGSTNIGKFFCPDQVDLGRSDLQIP